MLRTFAVLGTLLVFSGCGERVATREVPVSASRPDTTPPAADAATRAPRAIATH